MIENRPFSQSAGFIYVPTESINPALFSSDIIFEPWARLRVGGAKSYRPATTLAFQPQDKRFRIFLIQIIRLGQNWPTRSGFSTFGKCYSLEKI